MEGQSNHEEADDYKVGYKKPPKATQFQKGKSGNPNGRRQLSTITAWAKYWCEKEYVDANITFSKDGNPKQVTFSIRNGEGPIMALVALQLIKGAVEGDLFFIRELLDRTEGKAPQTITVQKETFVDVQPTDDGGMEIVESEIDDDGYDDEFDCIEEEDNDPDPA